MSEPIGEAVGRGFLAGLSQRVSDKLGSVEYPEAWRGKTVRQIVEESND